ncbi:TetR/AcrR family transcriptional regulator [Streptomyces gardneri]|uniref:TetR family transcriptional regulator n=1 Tax=Streptomyces gardneri TaxID=66892 RepID=A0A4Y3RSZ4_9ACTN|nr:TetR/AcrR family transcriptional regulator [Streptomyces gardneri]GEB59947.1 TetR family transcriptional regulator [Streptomyces gardneri]GHG86176.1 TetR family transcriptional regulator [Streptomyces gardneri]
MAHAREALLDAALAALVHRSWSAVRMADLAVDARVSRQTLYNEFGSKEGLARALVRREADAYLQGVRRLLADPAPPERNLLAVAEWTVARAATRPILRALLTGAWNERLPVPRPVRPGARPAPVPAQRRADEGPPAPGELVAATAACAGERWAAGCELAVRIALSHVVAPAPPVAAQCEEPESWSPMTPTMTRLIETILRVETTSPRKIIP